MISNVIEIHFKKIIRPSSQTTPAINKSNEFLFLVYDKELFYLQRDIYDKAYDTIIRIATSRKCDITKEIILTSQTTEDDDRSRLISTEVEIGIRDFVIECMHASIFSTLSNLPFYKDLCELATTEILPSHQHRNHRFTKILSH